MNKKLKNCLIGLNLLMFFIALYWSFNEDFKPEPIIVSVGQFATLITLIFEGKATNLITEDVSDNSEVNVDVHRGTHATTKGIKDSKVTIKTK